jgi:hypothetical protein
VASRSRPFGLAVAQQQQAVPFDSHTAIVPHARFGASRAWMVA